MLQILKILVVMVAMLCANNVFASGAQRFEEVAQEDGSILVERWGKIGEFVTEPVPKNITLSSKQKKRLWKGEDIEISRREIVITGILQPSVRGYVNEKHIKWLNGKYSIDRSKKQVDSNANLLIIALCIITFGILVVNALAREVFVYNRMILVVSPIIAIIGIICMYLSGTIFIDNWLKIPLGAVGVICYMIALIIIPLYVVLGEETCIVSSLLSILVKIFIGGLTFVVNGSIVIISTFICWDTAIMNDVSSGIIIEWLLYLVACFVFLPLSSVLAKSVVDSLKQKILG